jgi:hypothetical protein
VSKEVRCALDAELALQDNLNGFIAALKAERPLGLAMCEYGIELPPFHKIWFVGRGIVNWEKSKYLDLLQLFLSHSGKSVSYAQLERVVQDELNNDKSWFTDMMLPPLNSWYEANVRSRAQVRCLRLLIALQNHVRAGSDEVPKLTELGLPAETTTDPFTGEPLHVKKTPRGWLVYSVGPNFKDDGGKLDDPTNGDVGVGPPPLAEKPSKNDQEGKEKK